MGVECIVLLTNTRSDGRGSACCEKNKNKNDIFV